jgi:WD40 repeat protein
MKNFALFARVWSLAFPVFADFVVEYQADVAVFPQFGHSSSVNSVAFSPDGKQILSGSGGATIKLWDVASRQEIRSFQGHSGVVSSVEKNR